MKVRCGFTLIEILVVVSVVGILAVIVIPRYHCGKNEAKLACLCTNLHVGRRQIELYKIQHNGTLPAAVGETSTEFTRRMMMATDNTGAVGTQLGPYLACPLVNEFNHRCTVRVGGPAAGANTDGWRFDPSTGEFRADDNYDDNGDGVPDHVSL